MAGGTDAALLLGGEDVTCWRAGGYQANGSSMCTHFCCLRAIPLLATFSPCVLSNPHSECGTTCVHWLATLSGLALPPPLCVCVQHTQCVWWCLLSACLPLSRTLSFSFFPPCLFPSLILSLCASDKPLVHTMLDALVTLVSLCGVLCCAV